MSTTKQDLAISTSVGQAAANRPEDVLIVQQLLNKAGAKIGEDKKCGPGTIGAIRDYQRNFMQRPDGLVSVGGVTWRHLVEGRHKIKREPMVLLPQVGGMGYYPYSSIDKQYGSARCIEALTTVCAQLKLSNLGAEIGIGDISFKDGGTMEPHKSHKRGVHVDLRPLRKDGKNMGVTIADPQYSRERTKQLIDALLAHANVQAILFNDTNIHGVTFYAGHHNHLHVTMRS